MNLTGATFEATTNPMVASFDWEGEAPDTGSVMWQIVVHSGDRQIERRLGYKIVDGQPSAQFVWDTNGAWQATPEPDVDLQAHQLSARFNPLAMHGMGDGWTWAAVLNVNGDEVGIFQP